MAGSETTQSTCHWNGDDQIWLKEKKNNSCFMYLCLNVFSHESELTTWHQQCFCHFSSPDSCNSDLGDASVTELLVNYLCWRIQINKSVIKNTQAPFKLYKPQHKQVWWSSMHIYGHSHSSISSSSDISHSHSSTLVFFASCLPTNLILLLPLPLDRCCPSDVPVPAPVCPHPS